jgi:hypothetical protein
MYDDETQNLDSVKMWGSIPPPGTKRASRDFQEIPKTAEFLGNIEDLSSKKIQSPPLTVGGNWG